MIYVIIKRSVLDNVRNIKVRCVLNVSRTITKTMLRNACPYCKYNITEHSKMNKTLEDMFGDGIEM